MSEKIDHLDVIKMFLEMHVDDPYSSGSENVFRNSLIAIVAEIERMMRFEKMMKVSEHPERIIHNKETALEALVIHYKYAANCEQKENELLREEIARMKAK